MTQEKFLASICGKYEIEWRMFALVLLFLPFLFFVSLILRVGDLKGFPFVSALFDTGQNFICYLIIDFEKSVPGMDIDATHMITFDACFTAYQSQQGAFIEILFLTQAYKELLF